MDELEFDLGLPRTSRRRHGRRRPRAPAIRIALGGEYANLGDILLKLRVLQAFSQDPTRYPLHRVVRCAVRQELPELFDALAVDGGFRAHRLGEGELMLDGPDTFVSATGRRKTDYTSCEFAIWAHSRQALVDARERLLGVVGDTRLLEDMFTVDWHFTRDRKSVV